MSSVRSRSSCAARSVALACASRSSEALKIRLIRSYVEMAVACLRRPSRSFADSPMNQFSAQEVAVSSLRQACPASRPFIRTPTPVRLRHARDRLDQRHAKRHAPRRRDDVAPSICRRAISRDRWLSLAVNNPETLTIRNHPTASRIYQRASLATDETARGRWTQVRDSQKSVQATEPTSAKNRCRRFPPASIHGVHFRGRCLR